MHTTKNITPPPSEINIDFSKIDILSGRKRREPKSGIEKHYRTRFAAFLAAGFSEAEATWGANHGLSLRNKQVRQVIKHRKDSVDWLIKRKKYSWNKAVKDCAKRLRTKLNRNFIDDLNLFYEVSL